MSTEKPRQGARALHINGEVWWWQAGNSSVWIEDPDGKRIVESKIAILYSLAPSALHRGVRITFGSDDIKQYIKENLMWVDVDIK